MTNLQATRTRVVTWEDPTDAVHTGKTISGIAYLRALQSGELPPPPIAVLLGMWITQVSEGRVVQSMLPGETSYTTLELKVNYLRPITAKTGTVYSEGKIIHVGGRIATAEARLTDAQGKLYAHATTTCIILRPSSPCGRE